MCAVGEFFCRPLHVCRRTLKPRSKDGVIALNFCEVAAGDTDEVELTTPTTTALVNEGDTISFHSGGQADDSTTPCVFTAVIRNRRRHG